MIAQRLLIMLVALFLSGLAFPAAAAPSGLPAVDRFDLDLPERVVEDPAVARGLDELTREPCDKDAIRDFGRALEKTGRRRDAARSHEIFSDTCNGHPPSLRSAVNLLLILSDYAMAETVATKLIALEPYNDNGYFLRALARHEKRDHTRAIDDFVTALELFGNKEKISSVSYLKLSKSYEQLGRFCDAVVPIESWVALDPLRNDTSQTQAIIATLAERGQCARPKGTEDVFPLTRKGNVLLVQASINGHRGTFVFDTGATFVSLSKPFAQKAGVEIEAGSLVHLNTANGPATARRGRARIIALKSLSTENVPVIVQTEDGKGYGPGVDGLLGMSLLARFHITMDGKAVRLRRKG